jgi:lipoteichoic acid synthase
VLGNDKLNFSGFFKTLLSSRDWVYLLGLLVPFVLYNLALKASEIASLPGEDEGLARSLDLMRSEVFFNLGYALFWIALFAAVRRGALRRVVLFLFHTLTILVMVINACTHQYLRENGTTLDYPTLARWISKLDEVLPTLTRDAPLSAWILFAVALFYAALGPWLLTRAVERWWGGLPGSRSQAGAPRTSFMGVIGLWLLALGFGSLSLLVGSNSATGADKWFSRDPFVNVVLTGVQEDSTKEAEETATEVSESGAGSSAKLPAANARLVQTSQTDKRNVVLVHLESTRARSVTPYNEDLKTTPFLNELAKESLVTERTHVIVPRSSKGSTAVNCGIEPALYAGPEYEPGVIPAPCLARLLKEQGYRTTWFQSLWDTGDDSMLAGNFGYEEFYPSQSMNAEGFQVTNTFGYEDAIMLEPSERWLKTYGQDGPFLAQYFTGTGHYGYECVPNRYGYEHFSDDEEYDRYLNCLRYLDHFVENLFDQYKRLGLYENTIFVLYGDHGEGFESERGRSMHGDTIWEEGLHVPLIIHAPGWFEGGERAEGISSEIDILPTVVEMLGFEVKGGEYPGYSLLHPLPEDRTVMSNCITNRRCMASVKGHEKYIYHYDDRPEEFFDLSKDPLEQTNLASERSKEELDKRREELFAWRTKVNGQHGQILVSGNPVLGEE